MELIRQHLELGQLARAISKQSKWKSLKHVIRSKTNDHYLLLSAPATAALAIMKSGLHKRWKGEPEDPPINLLIVNAQTVEWIDEGQWYRYLSPMLGWNGKLSLTVQTADRSKHRSSRYVPVLTEKDRISVDIFEGTLPDLWKEQSPDDFDIAVWFCPDFSAGAMRNAQGWNEGRPDELAEGGIGPLLARKTPVFFTSYAESQEKLSMAILECYGYSAASVIDENPFSLVSIRNGENWSRTIAEMNSIFHSVESVDPAEGVLLTIATQMVVHSLRSGFAKQPRGLGETVQEHGKTLIHAMDGVYLDLESGEVWVGSGENLESRGRLKEAAMVGLRDFDQTWGETDRFVWAACAKQATLANHSVRAA